IGAPQPACGHASIGSHHSARAAARSCARYFRRKAAPATPQPRGDERPFAVVPSAISGRDLIALQWAEKVAKRPTCTKARRDLSDSPWIVYVSDFIAVFVQKPVP